MKGDDFGLDEELPPHSPKLQHFTHQAALSKTELTQASNKTWLYKINKSKVGL
jgi:hypothetical protein